MKGGNWGSSKVMKSGSGDFVPKGHGMNMQGKASEMGEAGSWGEFLPEGSKGLGVKGVSGAPKASGGSLGGGKWMPDGDRGWAKGT